MTWTHYHLVFRLKSPLHIGWRKVGNLMETRDYVTGRVLWGALTAQITRDQGRGHEAGQYKTVGDLLHKHFRFGYLWPALPEDPAVATHALPKVDWGEGSVTLYFPGKRSRWNHRSWKHPDFDYLFKGSFARTALDPIGHAAAEGSLWQIECIAPTSRGGLPVYLVGDLWVEESNLPPDVKQWRRSLGQINLGGERTYGWGRVDLVEKALTSVRNQETVHGFKWQEQDGEIYVAIATGEYVPGHVLLESSCGAPVEGIVEPFVGWAYGIREGRVRWSLQHAITYSPGCKATQTATFKVCPEGTFSPHGVPA